MTVQLVVWHGLCQSHSGRFVFDFAWARAWESAGSYYPKLVMAVPFTPATGPRMLMHPAHDAARLQHQLLQAVVDLATARNLSSIHALFIDEPLRAAASDAGWLTRTDCHFQWHNRGYRDFDDFLATFAADKRKKARRERRRVSEQGIEFETLTERELDERLLARIHALHAATFIRHGHLPYLTVECLSAMAAGLGDALIVKLARRDGEAIAAALFFRSDTTLYGRYWGADAEYHSLHFEACYYQGIELCIGMGLQHFEPGTQGEHKLARDRTGITCRHTGSGMQRRTAGHLPATRARRDR
jgi:predicted N-acyltransferase